MSKPSEDHLIIYEMAKISFGGQPKVLRFFDDNNEHHVDILTCVEVPQEGLTSYSTIALSDVPIVVDGEELSVRVELVAAIETRAKDFANALATAAFCIINTDWSIHPGAIFPNILAMYNCSETMKHLMFVPPFLWEDLETLSLASKTVAWLLAVPISDEEYQYAIDNGTDSLEELFEREQIDIFDIDRESVA